MNDTALLTSIRIILQVLRMETQSCFFLCTSEGLVCVCRIYRVYYEAQYNHLRKTIDSVPGLIKDYDHHKVKLLLEGRRVLWRKLTCILFHLSVLVLASWQRVEVECALMLPTQNPSGWEGGERRGMAINLKHNSKGKKMLCETYLWMTGCLQDAIVTENAKRCDKAVVRILQKYSKLSA